MRMKFLLLGTESSSAVHYNSGTAASDYPAARCSSDARQIHGGSSRSADHAARTVLGVINKSLHTKLGLNPGHARTDRHSVQVRTTGNFKRYRCRRSAPDGSTVSGIAHASLHFLHDPGPL